MVNKKAVLVTAIISVLATARCSNIAPLPSREAGQDSNAFTSSSEGSAESRSESISTGNPEVNFESGWIYGTYVHETESVRIVAEVSWYSDPEEDYIRLMATTNDGQVIAEFVGVVVDSRDNSYVAENEFGDFISYHYNGIDIITVDDKTDGYGSGFPGFGGTYDKIKDLSKFTG